MYLLLSPLPKWLMKPVKCPSVRCQHIQNLKAPRPLGRRRWNSACILYGSWDETSRKRNFEFRPLRRAGTPRTYLGQERPTPTGVLIHIIMTYAVHNYYFFLIEMKMWNKMIISTPIAVGHLPTTLSSGWRRAEHGPKFKSLFLRSFVPRPIKYTCQASSTSAGWSRSLKVLKMLTHGPTDGRTFDRVLKSSLNRWLKLVNVIVSRVQDLPVMFAGCGRVKTT